jgi:outer membrane immunogenic protein
MQRILLAVAVAFAAAAPALAADLPQPYAPPPPRAPAAYVPVVAPVYNWGGIYIGVNGGYGFGTSNMSGGPLGGGGTISSGDYDVSGGLVGGTFGANYQMGHFVIGVEGDIDWTDIKGTSSGAGCGGPATQCETDNSWIATLRGRAGFAWDRLLLFGTGGAAFGDITANIPGLTTSSTQRNVGWTAGAGIEYAFTDYLTAKAEYLYVDLGSNSCSPVCFSGLSSTTTTFTASLVRAGLNLKFNGF